jgi:hypothetical protein
VTVHPGGRRFLRTSAAARSLLPKNAMLHTMSNKAFQGNSIAWNGAVARRVQHCRIPNYANKNRVLRAIVSLRIGPASGPRRRL